MCHSARFHSVDWVSVLSFILLIVMLKISVECYSDECLCAHFRSDECHCVERHGIIENAKPF